MNLFKDQAISVDVCTTLHECVLQKSFLRCHKAIYCAF